MNNIDKRELLMIEYLVSDPDVFAKCVRILEPAYFEKPLNRVVDFIREYFSEFHGIPAPEIIEAETGVEIIPYELTHDKIAYTLKTIEQFCQESAMAVAINESVEHVSEGNFSIVSELVRQALLVRLDDSVGLEMFINAKERVETTEANVDKVNIGIPALDTLLNGVRRREVGIVYGGTGAGKSVMLANMAERMSRKGNNCLIITLEIQQSLYAMRLDTIFTGVDIAKHQESGDEIQACYESFDENQGDIVVRYLRKGTPPSAIRTVLLEYELKYGYRPDVLVVDYLQLMGFEHTKSENKFDIDEERIFALQSVADDYNCYLFTAGQLNRDGADIMDINPKHVAGGLSAVNGSDWSIAMVASEEDIDNNQFQVKQLKIRNGARTMKPITLYRCPKTLKVTDAPSVPRATSPVIDKSKTPAVVGGKEKLKKAFALGRGRVK